MLLANYVAGLKGVPGKQVRYASPVSLEEAIRISVSIQEAERQEKFNNSFYARHDSRTYSDSENSRDAEGSRTASQAEGRRMEVPRNANKARASNTRNAQTNAALRCYECEIIGHFASECPTKLKRNSEISNNPGDRTRPSIRDVSCLQAGNPHPRLNRILRRNHRVRETVEGREGRQLLPP
jgi:hypothetical protein